MIQKSIDGLEAQEEKDELLFGIAVEVIVIIKSISRLWVLVKRLSDEDT